MYFHWFCSHGKGGGVGGSRGVAWPCDRSVRRPRVQATGPGCQTDGDAGGDLREVGGATEEIFVDMMLCRSVAQHKSDNTPKKKNEKSHIKKVFINKVCCHLSV